MIHGENLIISLNGVAVAASKECSIELSQEYIESCSPTDGRTTTKIPTRYSWSVSTGGLVASAEYADVLASTLVTGTLVTLRFYDPSMEINRQGYALVDRVSLQGTVGQIATYSMTLQGSGTLNNMGRTLELAYFRDGDNVHFHYDSANDTLSIEDGDLMQFVQFTCPDNSKLYITQTNGMAVVMKGERRQYDLYIHNRNVSPFNDSTKRVYAGTSTTVLTLAAGTYTLFCNEDEYPSMIRLIPRE